MVLTREGAADRKNGIVIADTRDPLHPKEIAQFTDGVAGGVHSVYIYENPKFGQFVYLTNDGTGAIDIVNITDPAKPIAGRRVAHRPARCRALRARPRHRATACSTRATGTTGW